MSWTVPPLKEPQKTKEEFRREREAKVDWLLRHGYLRSEPERAPFDRIGITAACPGVATG